MIFELSSSPEKDTLHTDCPVYRIVPGGLYTVVFPQDTDPALITKIVETTFAPDQVRLQPPAHFLFMRADATMTSLKPEWIDEQIAMLQRTKEEMARERLARDEMHEVAAVTDEGAHVA